jgi:outer membrane protein OmpA-like peptidoglycan-associated protein
MHRSLCVMVALISAGSFAQTTGFSVERLRITPDRSGLIDVEWGRVMPHLQWDVGLYASYAKNPLVVYQLSDGKRLGAIVSDRAGGGVVCGIGLFDWVQASIEVPFVFFQRGDTDIPGATAQPLAALRPVGAGDLRFVPKVRLLKSEQYAIDLAFQLNVFFPLSGGTHYLGDRGVTLAPELAISKAIGGLRFAGNLAVSVLRAPQSVGNLNVGNEFQWRLGAGFRFHEHDASWVPLELDATLSSATALGTPYTRPNEHALEGRLQAGWHFENGLLPFIGTGVGLQPGWGTPDWRIDAGLRFALLPPPKKKVVEKPVELDSDGDGLFDSVDACPKVKGTKALEGCPDGDADADGIVDRLDRCPKQPEDKDDFKDDDGCLDPDDDADGVLDVKDRCRLEPEDKDQFQDDDGCPDPDNDGDGIVDASDACPTEKGVMENLGCPDKDTDEDELVDRLDNCPNEKGPKENNGCAKKQLVVLTADKLQILDSVYFKLNQAIIEARSFPLLDNVAAIMKDHPELKMVRVEGHTDSQGDDVSNLKLSQARAEAVRDYLVKKGIETGRLSPLGFGEAKPIATNDTKEGRAKNRRVEFNLGDGSPSTIKKSDNGPGTETLERSP